MGDLIDDILAFSRAGRLELEHLSVDMNALVDEVWAELARQRGDRPIEFHRAELPAVECDIRALRQVWQNLLGNAIKFTHQGHVTLRVAVVQQDDSHGDALGRASGMKFTVQDSGIGIAEHQKPRIFQRFAQAGDDIQSRYGGTGLGLSITQRLVELMGGKIGFDSTWGQGSTFWFILPLTAQTLSLIHI